MYFLIISAIHFKVISYMYAIINVPDFAVFLLSEGVCSVLLSPSSDFLSLLANGLTPPNIDTPPTGFLGLGSSYRETI